ncbi:MAG: hypothetical protein P8165_13730 [Deltaproteobacteria bacterium]|jgi:hypothetical protein
MNPIKFVQSWDPVEGRKQEYASFMIEAFQPAMKNQGLEVVFGWYTLTGGGTQVVLESLAESLGQVENALCDENFQDLLHRFMNLVSGYSSQVFQAAPWEFARGASTRADAKLMQVWSVRPGKQEAYDRFLKDIYLPQMTAMGLAVNSAWHLMVGAGPRVHADILVPDLQAVIRPFMDERYLQLLTRMAEVVTLFESRVLVSHQTLLHVLHAAYGRAIREVAPREIHAMVGPVGDQEGRE